MRIEYVLRKTLSLWVYTPTIEKHHSTLVNCVRYRHQATINKDTLLQNIKTITENQNTSSTDNVNKQNLSYYSQDLPFFLKLISFTLADRQPSLENTSALEGACNLHTRIQPRWHIYILLYFKAETDSACASLPLTTLKRTLTRSFHRGLQNQLATQFSSNVFCLKLPTNQQE